MMRSRLYCSVYHKAAIPASTGVADCSVLRSGVLSVLSGESSVQRKNSGILFPSRIISYLFYTLFVLRFEHPMDTKTTKRRPRIVLGITGSVATVKVVSELDFS